MIILWTSIINMSQKKGPAVHGPFSVRLPQCWRVRALVVVKGVLCFWRTGVVFYPSNLPVKAERSLFLSLSNNHLVNVSALMQSVDFILQYSGLLFCVFINLHSSKWTLLRLVKSFDSHKSQICISKSQVFTQWTVQHAKMDINLFSVTLSV